MSDFRRRLTVRFLWLACAVALPFAPVHAERAGVAAAVNKEALGTPPGGDVRQIVLGQDVLHDEVIETDANGQAQILMLDRTALTIGPNSTLVIDKFIYDPDTKDGELSLTLRRGLMRFTGGALSKNKAVGVRTPVATVGIRGGMALVQVVSPEQTDAGFLFGNELTVEQGGNVVRRIARPGFGTSINGEGTTRPSRWSTDRVRNLMAVLQGSAGRDGGLGRQVNGLRANEAAGAALPSSGDGQALNEAINQVMSNTEVLQNGPAAGVFETIDRQRPFNDLPRPELPAFYAFIFEYFCLQPYSSADKLWDISIPFESLYSPQTKKLNRDAYVGIRIPTEIIPIDQLPSQQLKALTKAGQLPLQ